jgi:Zn finger protein HypA/HybF involved in hydrogenase expression
VAEVVRTRAVVEELLRFGFSQAEIVAGTGRSRNCSAGRNRGHIKQRLIRLGLKQHRCETCGISEWLGKPLSLALHHINGDGDDNRLENLEPLCPNCHSQTENFAGRALRLRGVPAHNAQECSPAEEVA